MSAVALDLDRRRLLRYAFERRVKSCGLRPCRISSFKSACEIVLYRRRFPSVQLSLVLYASRFDVDAY